MFSWVVKVVPQPPDPSGKLEGNNANNASAQENKVTFQDEVKKEPETKSAKLKEEVTEANNNQGGVLSWLSNGLASALPQPVGTSQLAQASTNGNTEAKQPTPQETTADTSSITSSSKAVEEQGGGVIGWIVQELVKVVPQPEEKSKEADKSKDPEPPRASETVTELSEVNKVTECKAEPPVHDANTVPDAEPLSHIPVVEVVSEKEPSEVDNNNQPISPRVIDWLKQSFEKVIPQPPEIQAPLNTEASVKKEASAASPAPSPAAAPAPTPSQAPTPAEAMKEPSNSGTGEPAAPNGVVGWIFQELNRMIPQPVVKPKENTTDGASVAQNRGNMQTAP